MTLGIGYFRKKSYSCDQVQRCLTLEYNPELCGEKHYLPKH